MVTKDAVAEEIFFVHSPIVLQTLGDASLHASVPSFATFLRTCSKRGDIDVIRTSNGTDQVSLSTCLGIERYLYCHFDDSLE